MKSFYICILCLLVSCSDNEFADQSPDEFPVTKPSEVLEVKKNANPSNVIEKQNVNDIIVTDIFEKANTANGWYALRDSVILTHKIIYDASKFKIPIRRTNSHSELLKVLELQIELKKLEELQRIADSLEKIVNRGP